MTIHIDRRIYSDSCISKTIYSLADRYTIERFIVSEDIEGIKVIPKDKVDDALIREDLFNSLNDFKLRCIIEKETHDIKTILYAKAFSECEEVNESDME